MISLNLSLAEASELYKKKKRKKKSYNFDMHIRIHPTIMQVILYFIVRFFPLACNGSDPKRSEGFMWWESHPKNTFID